MPLFGIGILLQMGSATEAVGDISQVYVIAEEAGLSDLMERLSGSRRGWIGRPVAAEEVVDMPDQLARADGWQFLRSSRTYAASQPFFDRTKSCVVGARLGQAQAASRTALGFIRIFVVTVVWPVTNRADITIPALKYSQAGAADAIDHPENISAGAAAGNTDLCGSSGI